MPGAMVRLVALSYEKHVPLQLIPYMRVLKGLGEMPGLGQEWVRERIIIGTCATLGKLVQDSQATSMNFTHVLVSSTINLGP